MRIGSIRLHWIEVALGAVLLVLVGAAIIGAHSIQAAQASASTRLAPDLPQSVPQGIPAISRRTSVATASGAYFTEADVRQYLANHAPAYAVHGAPAPVVVNVQFLAATSANGILGEPVGMPDNTLLCVVRLTGTFESDNVPYGITPRVFNDGIMIFDATTGNLLVSTVGA